MSYKISVYYDGYLHIYRDVNQDNKFFYTTDGVERELKLSDAIVPNNIIRRFNEPNIKEIKEISEHELEIEE